MFPVGQFKASLFACMCTFYAGADPDAHCYSTLRVLDWIIDVVSTAVGILTVISSQLIDQLQAF